MAPEVTGGGELTQLVPHHVFRDVDGDELLAVVHRQGQVLMTRRSWVSLAWLTLIRRLPSTNGPFFNERATMYLYFRRLMMERSLSLFLRVL